MRRSVPMYNDLLRPNNSVKFEAYYVIFVDVVVVVGGGGGGGGGSGSQNISLSVLLLIQT